MSKTILTNYDFGGIARVIGLLDPSAAQDAATKAYVDSAVEGLAWKDSCRVATQANISIASPGATIDGITMATNDRVLVRSQTTTSENGIYIWNGAAVPMTRALDCSTAAELEQAVSTIEEGTSAGVTYRQTSINFTLGSSAVAWTTFGQSVGAASETSSGIAEIATQAETDTGTDDARIVTPLKLATWSGRKLKYSADLGDGSATSYTLTHNLGTRDVIVQVRRNSGSYDVVECDINVLTTNSVQLVFASAPTTNQFRAIVLG